jgi:hypothetical protein
MNLIQLEEIKTEAFYWVEFHITSTEPICWVFTSRRTKMQTLYTGRKNSLWFTRYKQTVDDVEISHGILIINLFS